MGGAGIAMSGGVDSAVAAYLVRESFGDARGITLKLLPGEDTEEIAGARAVCEKLGIPHETIELCDDFRQKVMTPFAEAYERGETPNPCILCNRKIKFGALHELAVARGIEKIATGHYARVERDATGRYLLKRAKDAAKDQSYVLYSLSQEQLSRTLFPLGTYEKEEVRALAASLGFANAKKHDSEDICFIPDGDYASFLERFTKKVYPDGDFIDGKGLVLGRHRGVIRYTIGQRKGLGIALGEPLYVAAKDAAANTVTLVRNEDLFRTTLFADDVNLIAADALPSPVRVTAKIRYGKTEAQATAEQIGERQIRVTFDIPQRAIAPGQAVVLYDGDTVIGGGRIVSGE